MKNKYTILRHAETIRDPNKNSVDWVLIPDALEKINEYIADGKFDKISKIISSTEPKAVATGKPILEYLKNKIPNLRVEELEELVEVKKGKKFLTDAEFANQKERE